MENMFLNKLKFNNRIDFECKRVSQEKLFKIREVKEKYVDKRNPIYDNNKKRWERGYVTYPVVNYNKKLFTLFNKNLLIDFKPFTIIVGENGCGKSTLLNELKLPNVDTKFYAFTEYETEEEYIEQIYKKWLNNKNRELIFSNKPKHIIHLNKLHKESIIQDLRGNMFGSNLNANNALNLFNISESSNGENILDIINSLNDVEDSLIILDEPETSLSIKSQIYVSKILKKLSLKNQIIVVTHSPYIMKLTDEVLDLRKRKYVNTKKYILEQEK